MAQSPGSSYQPAETQPAPHLATTEARAGERHGVIRILAISSILALILLGMAWLAIAPWSHVSNPRTGPAGSPTVAASQPAAR
jgi:hypothetical protein